MRLGQTPAVPRSALVVLLGAVLAACAVAGHGPPWTAVMWALTLGLWCLNERRRAVALALPVLLALVPAWPLHADARAFTGLYLHLALIGLAAALFVQTLDERERGGWWGLAALGLAWAFAPTPIGLFGLLGAALLRAQTVQRGYQPTLPGRAVGWLLGAAALIALGTTLLPRPVFSAPSLPGQGRSVQPPNPPSPDPRPTPPPPASKPGLPGYAPLPPLASFEILYRLTPYLLLALALLSSTLLLTAWRERAARGERKRLEDLVLAVALVVGSLMVLLSFWARSGGGPGLEAQRQGSGSVVTLAGTDPRELRPAPSGLVNFLNTVGWIGVGASLLFVLLAALGVFLLVQARSAGASRLAAVPPAPVPPDLSPEHRVRRTYRLMLAALTAAGLARLDAETPQEFLTRLATARPELEGAARTITGVYEPVRYGAQTDESGASAAEEALAQLHHILRAPERPA